MDRGIIPPRIEALEHVFFRTVFLVMLVSCLVFVGIAVEASRLTDVFQVMAPRLNVREEPRRGARLLYVLEEGAHVCHAGEQEENDGYVWARVAYLRADGGGNLLDREEGWVARQGGRGSPFIQEETRALYRPLVAVVWLKWKTVHRTNAAIQGGPFPMFVKRAVLARPDKVLHALVVAALVCVLFLILLLDDRISPVQALLASLLATNLLGLMNEGLDLVTETGAFELGDLAANAVGSVAVLLPFSLWVALRRVRAAIGNAGKG